MTLFGVTTRQKLLAVTAMVLGIALVVTVALGQSRIAFALAGILLTATLIVELDVRRRAGQLMAQESDPRALGVAIDDLKSQSAHLGELASSIARVETAIRSQGEQLKRSDREVMTKIHDQASEVEALIQLFAKVTPRAPMPSTGLWAPRAPHLLALFALVEQQRPELVLELGGGTSTVWLSYALTSTGTGRMVSVDHLEEFAERTRASVESHGFTTTTEVRLAPINPVQLDEGDMYQWYSQTAFTDLEQIDMIFVDGPPGGTRPGAKYPALPMLADQLADGATIVLAGVDAADQQDVVARWLDEFPSLERESNAAGTYEVVRYRNKPSD